MAKIKLGMYVLDGREPVPCEDVIEWARWMHFHERRVARTMVGECMVSTVFLGLDHGWQAVPILFETMAFGPEQSVPKDWPWSKPGQTYRPEICSMNRYATWDEALAGHKQIVGDVEKYVLETAVAAEEAIMAIVERIK